MGLFTETSSFEHDAVGNAAPGLEDQYVSGSGCHQRRGETKGFFGGIGLQPDLEDSLGLGNASRREENQDRPNQTLQGSLHLPSGYIKDACFARHSEFPYIEDGWGSQFCATRPHRKGRLWDVGA
jgi:hypothetical protein